MVERKKNCILPELARSMLNEYDLRKYFCAEAINTAGYVSNRALIRHNWDKTSHELYHNKIPNIGYFKVFFFFFFVANVLFWTTKKSWKIFTSKADRVSNKRTLVIEESMHVVFDESYNDISNEFICSDDLERNFWRFTCQ